ncbi:DUF6988 family protein [Undibacterium fentianense]|uniref:Uncharacterized protein n=1 Tax=Undibacterium fentianense TaxID=2828728 RepID=A0A941IDM0_9BURK|nr:hypothetical protein [Undibacterium fentianense]MBR7800118.1 hypothetical protein [Undibacterium fentianense]
MDLSRAEELQEVLTSIVDFPIRDCSPKSQLSKTLAVSSLQFAAAIRVLCGSGLVLGAGVTLRAQYEAIVRSVWALYRATESQVQRLSADLTLESQQASKNIPTVNAMIRELENVPQLENLLISLNEFKSSSWGPLNSFVHSGIHVVHWTKNGAPPQLLETIFRSSNGLTLISFQLLGILTGRQYIQSEIFSAATSYGNILPNAK